MIQLAAIEVNQSIDSIVEEPMKSTLESTLEYYKIIGFKKPWISYVAKTENDYIGTCAFKGEPVNNKVEVAYFTFPKFEGKGYATDMCKKLIRIALEENPNIIITARTLPEESASTSVLTKNGFIFDGKIIDPDDGEVFEWVFKGNLQET